MPSPANRILLALSEACSASVPELARTTGLSLEQVSRSACILVRRKLAIREVVGMYRISEAGIEAIASGKSIASGPQAPLAGIKVIRDSFRQRLWRAIRLERKGTIGDFVGLILGPTEDEAKATANAQHYILNLCRAGYMVRLPGKAAGTAPTSPGFGRYLMVNDTGPLAPAFRRAGGRHLYDANTGDKIPLMPAQEVTHEP